MQFTIDKLHNDTCTLFRNIGSTNAVRMYICFRWNYDRALSYMLENSGLSEARSRTEIRRYAVSAAQVTTNSHAAGANLANSK